MMAPAEQRLDSRSAACALGIERTAILSLQDVARRWADDFTLLPRLSRSCAKRRRLAVGARPAPPSPGSLALATLSRDATRCGRGEEAAVAFFLPPRPPKGGEGRGEGGCAGRRDRQDLVIGAAEQAPAPPLHLIGPHRR